MSDSGGAEPPEPATPKPKPEPKPATPPAPAQWTETLRKKAIEASLIGFPLAVISGLVTWLTRETTSEPWQVLVYLVPLAVVGTLVWRRARRQETLRLRGPFLIFFGVYVTLFSLAWAAGVLDGERRMKGYDDATPPSVFGLNRLGDWRYELAPTVEATSTRPMAVVRTAITGDRMRDRLALARLLERLGTLDVRAVALDLWFHEDDSTAVDGLLCRAVEGLRASGVPVVAGHGLDSFEGDPVVIPPPATLPCFRDAAAEGSDDADAARVAHLVGFAEADDLVRSVPLYLGGDTTRPALSLALVQAIDLEPSAPEDGLLRFLPPSRDVRQIDEEQLAGESAARRALRGAVVLVGTRAPSEHFQTPFGERLGVELHAMAVHSLATGSWLRRLPWWASFAAVFVSCWILVSSAARPNLKARHLALRTLGLSAALVTLAALGAAFFRLWIDVSYGLVALWLLLALLVPLRRRLRDAAD